MKFTTNTSSRLSLYFWLVLGGLISLGQLGRVLIANLIPIYAWEPLLFIWLIFNWPQQQAKSILSKYKLPILWLLAGWAVAWWQNTFASTSILYAGRLFFYIMVGVTAAQSSHFNTLKQRKIAVLLTGFLFLAFGLLQLVVWPDLRWLAILGWDDHYKRLASTLLDPTYAAIILIWTYFTWQYYAAKILKKYLSIKFAKYGQLYALVITSCISSLIILGIFLTYARAGYLAFIIVLIWQTAHNFKREQIAITGFAAMVGATLLLFFAFMPQTKSEGQQLYRISSILARTNSASQQIKSLSATDLFLGNGLFNYSAHNSTSNNLQILNQAKLPDNLFITIMSGTGIIGLVFAITKIVSFIARLQSSQHKFLAAALIGTLVHAQFNNDLTQPHLLAIMTLTISAWWQAK